MEGYPIYSIVKADPAHLEEICQDIRMQYERGIATCALFYIALVPEGIPTADKAGAFAKKFLPFRNRLREMGLGCGILVQATIGHGYPLTSPSAFRRYRNLNDGEESSTVCPSDDGFCEYIRGAMRTLAEAKPDIIMVDDDFRLIFRSGNGCACDWHMERFRALSGTTFQREELFAFLKKENDGEYAHHFIQCQAEALLKGARAMRAGIDEVDPTLPGAFCTSGNNMECAVEVASVLAGEGNPLTIRLSNGTYYPAGNRKFTKDFYRAATQIQHLQGKVPFVLAEADTCPQNRYALSAQWFHSHYVGTVLEGATGAKRWITRLAAYEPQSGVAYREILSRYRGFYDTIIRMMPDLEFVGCRIPLHPKKTYYFSENGWKSQDDEGDGWVTHVLERLGLPVFFSSEPRGCAFYSGVLDEKMTDAEWKEALQHPAVFSSDIALRLQSRGFGEHLGVLLRPWEGKRVTVERIGATGEPCAAQQRSMELAPLSSEVVVKSMAEHTLDMENYEPLYPACTLYRNKLGGASVVFAGTPITEFTYDQAFSFLNFSRKEQLVEILREVNCLPVYYAADGEMYCKAANTKDGGLFVALFNLSYDVFPNLPLGTDGRKIRQVEALGEDGVFRPVEFTEEEGRITVCKEARPMDPVILLLK